MVKLLNKPKRRVLNGIERDYLISEIDSRDSNNNVYSGVFSTILPDLEELVGAELDFDGNEKDFKATITLKINKDTENISSLKDELKEVFKNPVSFKVQDGKDTSLSEM